MNVDAVEITSREGDVFIVEPWVARKIGQVAEWLEAHPNALGVPRFDYPRVSTTIMEMILQWAESRPEAEENDQRAQAAQRQWEDEFVGAKSRQTARDLKFAAFTMSMPELRAACYRRLAGFLPGILPHDDPGHRA